MTTFYFTTQDSECARDDGEGCDLPDLVSAIDEAKNVLSEMAADGIPRKDGQQLLVEILNGEKVPVVRLTLRLEISFVAIEEGAGKHTHR
ncbi:hypothetical protein [Rhizobium sp. RCAM05973]|uniref:DUF6894 family protein n=1 Tax=Rhizobium sp. RCAM05973 TaxID=2994066 RepID=UPI0022EBD1EA|nr:hypothetical protein [Rhizobium sp. RCAM05973]